MPTPSASGEAPWAWIVVKEEFKNQSPESIKAEVKSIVEKSLAKYKWLEEVVIIDSMPEVRRFGYRNRQILNFFFLV
jgi:acyl-CoA synthetase (AMP-forming)/AMP-acid ligase II